MREEQHRHQSRHPFIFNLIERVRGTTPYCPDAQRSMKWPRTHKLPAHSEPTSVEQLLPAWTLAEGHPEKEGWRLDKT
jgi:hypothetical protein